jgi:hypothetical protein
MITANEMTEGMLVWRDYSSSGMIFQSYPCVVVSVKNDGTFILLTLNNFEEIELPHCRLRELIPCELENIKKYFQTHKRIMFDIKISALNSELERVNNKITAEYIKSQIEEIESKLKAYTEKVNEFLRNMEK